ncbi:ubiquitin interaction domain-containing protein [Metarhizium robertsii ARSEF 23]|uniref:Ubiquitin interaction domain-containing protein n=1 Tax=Metarhizium robertsii (strain ARSEF 23 / ATCC MYA-3075) TaxID=655844 RepID=E9EL33_METRA|nr:ubiquitin interaction domain-containing protein [Metarhizium robertsii ARSEF 23]EFZ04424.2 ubiquitin interaction domain-containing protein [Metarhizium robertsii ARSEF 23]
MASMAPSEEQISQVIDFAGLNPHDDRTMVIQALKDTGGNVEAVVMQYFDNPVSFRQKFTSVWDESLFQADRDGTVNPAAFHIESINKNDGIKSNTPPLEGYGPMAPSRPPSRSNGRSPLGRMVDWAAGDTPAGSAAPSTREDEDMQRALRESAQEAGIALPEQQSGLMSTQSTSTPYFGPANRNDYDQGSWAMVPAGPSESQVPSAPAPSLRKRMTGAPAFLVQGISTVGNHGLGGLLTVLHQIPLARNALLETGAPAASYGFNSEWWKGQEILPTHALARLQAGDLQWGNQDESKPDVEEEIHRLMAFLDSTERSYGSVSVLTDLIPYPSLGPEKQFYEYLGPKNEEKLKPLIHSAALSTVFGDDLGDEEAKFGLLEMEHLRSDYTYIKTVYESLDHTMWSDVLSWNELHEGSKMAMFTEMGEVLAIKINGDGPQDSIDIPEKLYLEKYQTNRKDEARRIQMSWCDTKNAIMQIAKEEQQLFEWRNDWDHQMMDKKQMIEKARNQWQVYSDYLLGLGKFRGMVASGFDTDSYPDYRMAPCELSESESSALGTVEEVLQTLLRMLTDIDKRLSSLNSQMEQIMSKQRFLGRLLTQPEKQNRPRPMTCKEFLLRGVVTPSDVTYVCQRAEPDLIELGEQPKQLDQWWRLAYAPNGEQPVQAEKVEIERVLRDVWQETKTPLMVYATETALNAVRAPLTAPLQRFATAENKAFRQELHHEATQAADAEAGEGKKTPGSGPIDPISPSKRKHRADSVDSMDSNRASIGSDDAQNGFDNPFEDGQTSTATMTASGTPVTTTANETHPDLDTGTTEVRMVAAASTVEQ